MKYLYLFFALLLPVAAPAAITCSEKEACITYTATTTWEDGTPIAADKVVVYTVVGWLPNTAPVSLKTVTALEATITGLVLGNWCFAVFSTVDGASSVLSNSACKLIRFSGPTEGSIVAPTDGSIVYPK